MTGGGEDGPSFERLDMAQAVQRYAPDGATVYLGNFGAQLFAVGHELIRARRRRLHAVFGSGGILMDQLLGARVLRHATFTHCWSPVGPSPAWNFRRCAARGDVRLDEVSLGVLVSALRAAAWDVPFMPTTDLSGTAYEEPLRTAGLLARVASPFGDAMVTGALALDAAFVHVDAVDADGNGVIRGPVGESVLAALAARHVVLVAEEAVPAGALREREPSCAVPGLLTSAVVVEPLALHPDGAPGRYDRDTRFYRDYAEAAATEEGFAEWLDAWVLGIASRRAYRERLGRPTSRVP